MRILDTMRDAALRTQSAAARVIEQRDTVQPMTPQDAERWQQQINYLLHAVRQIEKAIELENGR